MHRKRRSLPACHASAIATKWLRPGGTVLRDGAGRHAPCMWLLSAIGPAVTVNLNINFLRRGARPGEGRPCGSATFEARQAACGRRGQPALGHIVRSDRHVTSTYSIPVV